MFKLCLPSILYLISFVLFQIWGILYFKTTYLKNFKKYSFTDFITDFIAVIFHTWLLNYLYNINYKVISWILLFIIILLHITLMYFTIKWKLSNTDLNEDTPLELNIDEPNELYRYIHNKPTLYNI
jgi:hypothetical protein